jgi:hypothetical protein
MLEQHRDEASRHPDRGRKIVEVVRGEETMLADVERQAASGEVRCFEKGDLLHHKDPAPWRRSAS